MQNSIDKYLFQTENIKIHMGVIVFRVGNNAPKNSSLRRENTMNELNEPKIEQKQYRK